MGQKMSSLGVCVLAVLLSVVSKIVVASTDETCEKDTQENCIILSCGSKLNATCKDKECYCKEGSCAKPTGELNNLACEHTSKCSAYAKCTQLNLEGDCCPTPGANGTHLECCFQGDEADASSTFERS